MRTTRLQSTCHKTRRTTRLSAKESTQRKIAYNIKKNEILNSLSRNGLVETQKDEKKTSYILSQQI